MQTSIAVIAALLFTNAAVAADAPAAVLARGRYVADMMGCNDCHSAGYAQSAGTLPQSQWLMGNPVGQAGSWGTTYASNLRIYMKDLTADEWVARARTMTARPPMPWFKLRQMDEADLRAVYALIRSLGPVGAPVPAYLPPDQQATGPVVRWP